MPLIATDLNINYAGVGRLFARRYGAASTVRPRELGNCSLLTVQQELETEDRRDYTRGGGGLAKRRSRLKRMKLAITMLSFHTENLVLAAAGDAEGVAEATITNEAVKGYKGELARLAHPPKTIAAVNKTTGGALLVPGTDYVLSPGGVQILPGSSITDGDDLQVDYTHLGYDLIDAGTNTSTELELFFEGLNDAQTLEPMLIDFWRVDVPPASELALIGEQMGELKFECEVMKDATRPAGQSPFWRARKAAAAAG